jgi:hypothetical protein
VIDQRSQQAQQTQSKQGQDGYPVDNNFYNVMAVMVSKLESIEAYKKS